MAQPIPQNYMAYDRTIVVFSPDGRLLQVEYARQMVKNGSTSIGIKVKDGVILGAMKGHMPLAVEESHKKIWEIDPLLCPHCGGLMKIISFITEFETIKKILNHLNLWQDKSSRDPPSYLKSDELVYEPDYSDLPTYDEPNIYVS